MEVLKKAEILKQYLKQYLVNFNKKLRENLETQISLKEKIILVYGSEERFREIVQFFLIRRGRKFWKHLTFSDLLSIRMGNSLEYPTLTYINEDIIIVSFFGRDMKTKVDDSVLYEFLRVRTLKMNKDTIIYTDMKDIAVKKEDVDIVFNVSSGTAERVNVTENNRDKRCDPDDFI